MLKLIGLCGRSGSGKSYVCKLAAELGFYWIDADEIYRQMMEASPILNPCKLELVEAFGSSVLHTDGSLNRSFLSSIVFSENQKDQLNQLNSITHKYILNEMVRQLSDCQAKGYSLALWDAPTLFESHLDQLCDAIVSVIATDEVCLSRILRRDGVTEEQARRRLAVQLSVQELKRRSDFVIDNSNPTKDELLSQLMQIRTNVLAGKRQ